jgi:hypothetical protein
MNDLELHRSEQSFKGDFDHRRLKKMRTWSKKGKTLRKHAVSGQDADDSIPPSHGPEKKTPSGQVAAYNETYDEVTLKAKTAAQKDSEPAAESQQVGREQAKTILYNEVQNEKNCPADMPGLMDEKDGVRGQRVDLSSPRDGGKTEAFSKTQAVLHRSSGQTNGGTKRRAVEDPRASQRTNERRSLPAKPDEELQNIFRTSAKSFIDVRNKKQPTKRYTSKIAGSSPVNKSASVLAGASRTIPRKERQLHGLANPVNECSKILPRSKGSSKIEFLAELPPQKEKLSYEPKSLSRKIMLSCSKSPPQKSHRSASAKHFFDRSNNRQTIHHDNVLVKRAWKCRHPVISEMSTADAAPTGIPEAPPQSGKKTQKVKAQRMTLKTICHTIESEEEKYGGL